MKVYWSSPYTLTSVYKDLQTIRVSQKEAANFLMCPAVRDLLHNVYALSLTESFKVKHVADLVERSDKKEITRDRLPHLKDTNIFNILGNSYFFSEEPLKIKVTAPYYQKAKYQERGTFIGGVFDIGRWFRPINSEIIAWEKQGEVEFEKDQPLFYVEFMTDSTIDLIRYESNPLIEALSAGLVSSPFQTKEGLQGSLESRYQAFENSDYRKGLIEEIKAALVSDES